MATEYPVESLNISQIVTSLTNTRDPNPHALTMHAAGMPDALKLTDLAAADNVETVNATTTNPGLCPKLSGVVTEFLNGAGVFTTPEGSGSGSSGLTYPGSSSVWLNGNGDWSAPNSAGSTFKPWITIGRSGSGADHICDGSADNVEIQNAVNAAVSGGTIAFLSGNYNLAARVNVSGKNLHFIGFGTVTLTCATGSDMPVLYCYGSLVDTEALTGNASMGSNTISVGSTANVQAGDIIKITCSTSWSDDGEGQDTGESYGCFSADSGTITLDQPLLRAYTTSTTATARIYRPVKISVENIEIINQGATGSYQGIQFRYARDCEVMNCTFRNNGMSAISLYTAYGVEIANNRIYDCRLAGYGYGVVLVDASAHINIHDNFIDRCRHTIAGGTSDGLGVNRDVRIHHNTLIGGPDAGHYVIDSHRNAIDYTVTENYIVVSSGNIGFSDGTRNSIFSKNFIYGFGVAAAAYEKNGEIEGGRYTLSGNRCYDITLNRDNGGNLCRAMKVEGNYIYNSPGNGIAFTSEIYEQLTISNNTIENCAGEGIIVYHPAAATHPGNIIISNNNINSVAKNGIYLRNYNSTYKIRGSIVGNVINGVDTGNTACSGIHLYNVTSTTITGNTVVDDTEGMQAAIAEDTGCDYNVITGNIVGGGVSDIAVVGGNTVNQHNVAV